VQTALDAAERACEGAARGVAGARAIAIAIAFAQRPEIRAVHSQLLLHEVQRERARQALVRERREGLERDAEDAAAARRARAREVAGATQAQRPDEREDEALLAKSAQRLLHEEALARLRMHEEAGELARLEDERIARDRVALDAEQEARADASRRAERQAVLDGMTARQQEALARVSAQRAAFDDRQGELQFRKERAAVEALREKERTLRDERHREFLESRALLEARRAARGAAPFPLGGAALADEEAVAAREAERARELRDIADFQRRQAQEKREREAAEKEREKLEYRRSMDVDAQRTAQAQEYARDMLLQARQTR
jgi:hypothetical protein